MKLPSGLHACHHPSLDSVLISAPPHSATTTRAFLVNRSLDSANANANANAGAILSAVASKYAQQQTIAPHSHRTSIRITVLQGSLRNTTFHTLERAANHPNPDVRRLTLHDLVPATRHTYSSKLAGGTGELTPPPNQTVIPAQAPAPYAKLTTYLSAGGVDTDTDTDTLYLEHDDIHTVFDWSHDAVWLVEEGPTMTETTTVLLRPEDNFTTEGLYTPMSDEDAAKAADRVQTLRWRRDALLAARLQAAPNANASIPTPSESSSTTPASTEPTLAELKAYGKVRNWLKKEKQL